MRSLVLVGLVLAAPPTLEQRKRFAETHRTGKNADESDPPLDKTLLFSFAPQPDGGAPLGGEWEARDSE